MEKPVATVTDMPVMADIVKSVTPAPLPSTDYTIIRGKTVLVSPSEEQYDLLRKRLQSRIDDSRGETIFEIGIGEGNYLRIVGVPFKAIHLFFMLQIDGGDNGLDQEEYAASLATLQSLATTLDADCVELRQRKSEKGMTGQYLIRRRVDQADFMEIRLVNFRTDELSFC